MELVTQTPKERWEQANAEMSKHCFEVGRLTYSIQLDREEIERKERELKNMRVDFDKLNKELQRSTEAYLASQKAEKGPLPETLPRGEFTPEIPGA